MLSESQQKRVWEGMLSAEIRANYFADYYGRFRWRQRAATCASIVLSSGAFATHVSSPAKLWSSVLVPGFSLVAALLSAYSLVAQNQQSTFDAAGLHERWNRLSKEYQNLWDDMYAEDAAEQLKRLEATEIELSKAATGFPNDEKAMRKGQRQVQMHHALTQQASA